MNLSSKNFFRIYRNKKFNIFIKSFSTLNKIESQSRIKLRLFNSIEKEENMNNLLIFYFLLNAPFYMVTITTGIYPNLINVDYLRMSIRSLMYIQSLNSGINIYCLINKATNNIKNKIENSFETNIEYERKKLNKYIMYALSPYLVNIICSQFLINKSILENSLVNSIFLGFYFSNFLNFYIVYKLINSSGSYFKTNMIFTILNLIFLTILLHFIKCNSKEGHNPLKRPNDLNRLEYLNSIEEVENEDLKILEDEIDFLYKNLSSEDIRRVEEIYNTEDKK